LKFHFPPFARAKQVRGVSQPVNLHVYPGSIIDVSDISEFFCIDADGVQTVKPLPPGVPLDEDILNVILYDWYHLESFKQQVLDETAEQLVVERVADHFSKNLQILYMEALWRQINKNKKHQQSSGT
jgi:hypothetical protein